MIIRGLTKADFDYVVSVLDRWWGGPAGERAHPVYFYELGKLARVAEEDGAIVGFLLGFVAPTDPPTGYVHLVGIAPDHRRNKVGQRLYEDFAEACRREGATRMKALSAPGHEGSIRFHEALGFHVHEDPNYAGEGRARVVFTKNL